MLFPEHAIRRRDCERRAGALKLRLVPSFSQRDAPRSVYFNSTLVLQALDHLVGTELVLSSVSLNVLPSSHVLDYLLEALILVFLTD